MATSSIPTQAPDPMALDGMFIVYETRIEGDQIHYYGTPLVPVRDLVSEVWPLFREQGYEVRITRELGEWILIAEPVSLGIDGVPWTNVILVIATIGSTLFAGSAWYHVTDPLSLEILRAWPFAASIMFVLGVHELGHYVMSRYHRVNASLPYFIPVPTLIGTMGAVIKMEGQIPSRKALFDIGVAGPLAGLGATVLVTIVGLHLPPVEAPAAVVNNPDAIAVELGFPPLLEMLAWATNQPLSYPEGVAVNPVVIAAWVGLFVTFLNMIPVGQLDGGHIIRSILGERGVLIAQAVPVALLGLAAYVYLFRDVGFQAVIVWVVWGLITTFLLAVGYARPIDEESIGSTRVAIGILTFLLAVLCFHPIPIQIHA